MAQRRRGFTLIELTIVTALISVLCAIALPTYRKMECRARTTEWKSNFKLLEGAVRSRNAEFGLSEMIGANINISCTGTDIATQPGGNPIGFTVPGNSRYQYSYTSSNVLYPASQFLIQVFGCKGDVAGDNFYRWAIQEQYVSVADHCATSN